MPWYGGLGGREADHVAGRVIDAILAEHGTAAAAATLPGGAGTGRTQIGIIAKLVGGQGAASGSLVVNRV
ncbi:MAG TPA: hypothetical protein VIX20_01295 [Ktedonobacteraceae bacterium]